VCSRCAGVGIGDGREGRQNLVLGDGHEREKEDAGRKASPKKLSYKDKYALETLPGEMEKMRVEAEKLQATLASPDGYANDSGAFKALAAELDEKQSALAAAEERWLELEMLREEIGT